MEAVYIIAVIFGIGAAFALLQALLRRTFPGYEWRLMICLVPIILSGLLVGVAVRNQGDPEATGKRFHLGVDLAGGSILVYEVDPKFWESQSDDFRHSFSADQLASRIKTRIDPNNLREITIRPIAADASRPPRVEIVLPIRNDPNNKNSAGQIEEIKRLIQQQGQLEFRILAYRGSEFYPEDADAMNAAKTQLQGYTVGPNENPPPPPGFEGAYEWLEMDRSEIESLLREKVDLNQPGYHEQTYAYFNAPDQRTPGLREDEPSLGRHFVLTRRPLPNALVTGDNMEPASIFVDRGRGLELGVHFGIRPEAQERFFELTKEVGKNMAIIFDRKVISAPRLNDRLSSNGIITLGGSGADSQRRLNDLARILQAGSLPAALRQEPVSEMTLGPGLGEDTIRRGTYAVLGSFVAVLVFMVIYYRFAGLVAVSALFANLLLTVAFLVFANATITLPGLAGLVLMLGMAVDANVLIYERLREEREKGANLALAIRHAYDRAFPTILDTHLTSIFTAIVLYAVGTDQLKGFGISLTMGLVISLFTSLFMTRTFFDLGLSRGWIKELSMLKFLAKPNIDFMRVRNYWFAATLILSILGVAVFISRGDRGLNIDFTGGTAYSFQFKEPQDIQYVREKIMTHPEVTDPAVDAVYPEANVGTGPTRYFTLRSTNRDPKGIDSDRVRDPEKIRHAVVDAFGQELLYTVPKAGPITDVPADQQGKEKRDKQFDVSFTHREPTREEVEKVVAHWFNEKFPGVANKEFFEVVGKEKGKRTDYFKSVTVRFKLPPDQQALGEELRKYVEQTLYQPVSDRLENFDSGLAGEMQGRAISAIVLSWLAIVGYLWFRFGNWTFGVAAVLCLVHDLMFTVGIIAGCHYIVSAFGNILLLEDFKLDLPAVAALLTLVGYSVNDTIVVFDRIREVRGKNPLLTAQMINDSVNQTLSRTLIVSFITWLVVLVLYIFGGEGVKLFAFVMVIGVIVGTYSSIFVASPLLLILGEGRPKTAATSPPARRQLQTAK